MNEVQTTVTKMEINLGSKLDKLGNMGSQLDVLTEYVMNQMKVDKQIETEDDKLGTEKEVDNKTVKGLDISRGFRLIT